ncbi:MAG TPA: ABC transporter permease [Dehalococcoidia bacterium]|nr:ABC transporter permease [Dehalococcoidia bacterium]
MATNRTTTLAGAAPAVQEPRPGGRMLRRISRTAATNPLGVFGAVIILALVVIGIFAPLIRPYAINQFSGIPNAAPSHAHLFGTDYFGQDIFSRVVQGSRISLEVGFISVGLGTLAGLAIGMFSGYSGGGVDGVIMRIVDTAIAFPQLILLLAVVRVLGPSIRNVIIVIAIAIIPSVARIIRGTVLAERQNVYIEAARASGASDLRIILRHLTPNVLPLAIVVATTLLGGAILAEASLSFLGLGIPPPNPSWGADISASRTHVPLNPWSALFPGIAISLTVLGFNLLGDAVRDILDPRLRRGR